MYANFWEIESACTLTDQIQNQDISPGLNGYCINYRMKQGTQIRKNVARGKHGRWFGIVKHAVDSKAPSNQDVRQSGSINLAYINLK